MTSRKKPEVHTQQLNITHTQAHAHFNESLVFFSLALLVSFYIECFDGNTTVDQQIRKTLNVFK